MNGFDLYEQWRSCLFEVSAFVAPSWDALEVYERRAWEELDNRVEDQYLAKFVKTET